MALTRVSNGVLTPNVSVTSVQASSSVQTPTLKANVFQNTSGAVRPVVINTQTVYWNGTSSVSSVGTLPGLFGLTSNRSYGTLATITITPESVNSKFLLFGSVGFSSRTKHATGAEGIVFVLNNTTGYDMGNYPWYSGTIMMPNYQVDCSLNYAVSPGTTSPCTFTLRHYAYAESGTHQSVAIKASFIVQEILG